MRDEVKSGARKGFPFISVATPASDVASRSNSVEGRFAMMLAREGRFAIMLGVDGRFYVVPADDGRFARVMADDGRF
jgi:hypothetical protein